MAQTLSPAELSFLHSSLSLDPPIRPDLRTPTQFRPLVAEMDVFANTNGSARICFGDGTEAIVGVKAEVERTARGARQQDAGDAPHNGTTPGDADGARGPASAAWVECSIDMPGHRDDDGAPVFLASMIAETLAGDAALAARLRINARWHWRLHVDVLLLSPPLAHPLPLLSLTAHLALLDARLPRLVSDPGDDPLFDDDWAAAVPLYACAAGAARPPVALLVMTVGANVFFDPGREELAVADAVLAVSVAPSHGGVRLLAIRTIDPPSRLTPPGIPNSINPATQVAPSKTTGAAMGSESSGAPTSAAQEIVAQRDRDNLWAPRRGGVKRSLVAAIVQMVVRKGGVGEEVVEGLAAVTT